MIFLKTWLETNSTHLQIECASPVTKAGEHLHMHPFQENRFQIISGELSFQINGKIQKVQKGDIASSQIVACNPPYSATKLTSKANVFTCGR